MKKISICLLFICSLLLASSMTFASNFYDTKGTIYEGVVDRISMLGIINGLSERTFGPNKSLTRAELAKMVVYTKGLDKYANEQDFEPLFKDIKNHWAKDYIFVAVDLGVLKGYDDGTFNPDKEVSYAEAIAVMLRSLGYTRLDETSGSTWYSPYIKRMYDIRLDRGTGKISSYTMPAKRGDIAVMWWNMLISDRWAISAEYEESGLYYTYSSQTQLELLFPGYEYVYGTVSDICSGTSGDRIGVTVGGRYYETDSNVPIHALGATGSGVVDKDGKIIYGFSIDDDLENYKLQSGPIFYLEELGYNLNKVRRVAVYGYKSAATYAHLLVSIEDNSILRAVLVDASDSIPLDSVKVEYDKDDEKDEEEELRLGNVYFNGAEEPSTTTDAVVIIKGQKVAWEDVPTDVILTKLSDSLFTYDDKTIEGNITYNDSLTELYVDSDKYIVSDNCIYTIYDKTTDKNKLIAYRFNKIKKSKLDELLLRKATVYLNVNEEIARIDFGKYRPNNIAEKYSDGEYRLLVVERVGYFSSGDDFSVSGKDLSLKSRTYRISEKSDEPVVGDLVIVSGFEEDDDLELEIIEKDRTYGDDTIVLYEPDDEYRNDAFGEYTLNDDTLMYRVLKEYKDNSTSKVNNSKIEKISSIDELGDLSKYKIVVLANDMLEVEVIYAIRELNKTTYPVARIVEMDKDKEFEKPTDGSLYRYVMNVKVATVGGSSETYKLLSGDCEVGELVTYELSDNEEEIKIKERFKLAFLGYSKDVVIESFDKKLKAANVVGSDNVLDLNEEKFEYNGKEYDLLEYKYLLANVRYDNEIESWKFTKCDFYEKENLVLEPGDRIAFGELSGIAIIYRGY